MSAQSVMLCASTTGLTVNALYAQRFVTTILKTASVLSVSNPACTNGATAIVRSAVLCVSILGLTVSAPTVQWYVNIHTKTASAQSA